MISETDKELILLVSEALLYHCCYLLQGLGDFLQAHPWVVMGCAVACPEHVVWVDFLDVFKRTLEGHHRNVTARTMHAVLASFDASLACFRLSSAAVVLPTVCGRPFQILRVQMCVREVHKSHGFPWVGVR